MDNLSQDQLTDASLEQAVNEVVALRKRVAELKAEIKHLTLHIAMTAAPANEKSTSEDKWDHCPKCTGSFSFRKPVGNICPWCQQAISEPPVFSSGVRGNFSHVKREFLIHLAEDGNDKSGQPVTVNAADEIRRLRKRIAELEAQNKQFIKEALEIKKICAAIDEIYTLVSNGHSFLCACQLVFCMAECECFQKNAEEETR